MQIFSNKSFLLIYTTAAFLYASCCSSFAGPGIFINDGTDDGCIWTYDDTNVTNIGNTNPRETFGVGTRPSATPAQLGGSSRVICIPNDKATQKNRVLFYGDSTSQQTLSLTLGGELFVNSGDLGLGGGTDGGGIRIGSISTLNAASGEHALAIGAGNEGTIASAKDAIAIGSNSQATTSQSVALGAGSKDGDVVTTSGVMIDNKYHLFAGSNPTSTVSIGDTGRERTLTNVAAGRVNELSTDAVNGSQLFATNQALETIASSIKTNNDFSVRYSANDDGTVSNAVTFQGGDPNSPVLLDNVAGGIRHNSAVNVGQLKNSIAEAAVNHRMYTDNRVSQTISYVDQKAQNTLDRAAAYTDSKFGMLNREIMAGRREARQAAAIGLAASSLRYDDRPGKLSASVGGGFWRDETALSAGMGNTSEEGNIRANVSATSAGEKFGFGAGFIYTFN